MVGLSALEIIKLTIRIGVVLIVIGLSITISCQRETIQKTELKNDELRLNIQRCEDSLAAEKELLWFATTNIIDDRDIEAAAIDEIIDAKSGHVERLEAIERLDKAGDISNNRIWLNQRVPDDVCRVFNTTSPSDGDSVHSDSTPESTFDSLPKARDKDKNEPRFNNNAIRNDSRLRGLRGEGSSHESNI